jgi:hypothetical protein
MSVDSPVSTALVAADPPRRPGPRHARRVRRLPLWITVVGWVVVAVLAVVAAMRLFAWDALEPFGVLNTVTGLIYLPAWIVLVVALVGMRYALALGALVIAVLQVIFLLPELTASEPVPTWTRGAPTISLLDANVYAYNHSMAGYAAQIKATRPDLVTMEEAIPADVRQLTDSGALRGLPHTIEFKRYDPDAFFIASAYPLATSTIVYRYGRPLIVKTAIELPSGLQPLWVVHTTAPLPATFSQWKGQAPTTDTRPFVNEIAGPTWGYHFQDINLALGNLVNDVQRAEVAYTK